MNSLVLLQSDRKKYKFNIEIGFMFEFAPRHSVLL